MWKQISVLALLVGVQCTPVEHGYGEKFVGAISECIDNDTTLCLKEKALKITDKLASARDLNLFEGMSLVNTGSARSSRSYEQLSDDPKTRESQIEERIVNNVGDFLENHVIQLRLSDGSEESRDLDEEEGRGKNKKKKKAIKKLLPLLLLLKLKLAALIPLFLGIIAFVAVKALFLGKIVFAMSAFSSIRKLLSKFGGGFGGDSHSHVHTEEHPGYSYEPASQGWSRQVNDAQNLAYSGHINQ